MNYERILLAVELNAKLKKIEKFLPLYQAVLLKENIGDYGDKLNDETIGIINHLYEHIERTPVTYEQNHKDGMGIAYLHYFSPSFDWYITEKDIDGGTRQAFGYVIDANMPDSAELGYISIDELTKTKFVEIDYHFTPLFIYELNKKG